MSGCRLLALCLLCWQTFHIGSCGGGANPTTLPPTTTTMAPYNNCSCPKDSSKCYSAGSLPADLTCDAASLALTPVFLSKRQLNCSKPGDDDLKALVMGQGCTLEDFFVTTADKYILTLQHLQCPKLGTDCTSRRPVLLVHGILASGASWVLNDVNHSLGYFLTDNCFDVWLFNSRGSDYSRDHKDKISHSCVLPEYWNIDIHKIGYYDLSACIDFILTKTGNKNLTLFGHSMGATATYILLTTRKEYNQKVNFCVLMQPAINMTNSPFALIAIGKQPPILALLECMNIPIPRLSDLCEILDKPGLPLNITRPVRPALDFLCTKMQDGIFGPDCRYLNESMRKVYGEYLIGTESLKVIGQLVRASQQCQLVHPVNPEKNLYPRTMGCPAYDISNFKVPTMTFASEYDQMVSASDAMALGRRLPGNCTTMLLQATHLSMFYAINATDAGFDFLLCVLKGFFQGSIPRDGCYGCVFQQIKNDSCTPPSSSGGCNTGFDPSRYASMAQG